MYVSLSILIKFLNKIMNSIHVPVSSNIFAETDFIKTNKHAVAFNWEQKNKWKMISGDWS